LLVDVCIYREVGGTQCVQYTYSQMPVLYGECLTLGAIV